MLAWPGLGRERAATEGTLVNVSQHSLVPASVVPGRQKTALSEQGSPVCLPRARRRQPRNPHAPITDEIIILWGSRFTQPYAQVRQLLVVICSFRYNLRRNTQSCLFTTHLRAMVSALEHGEALRKCFHAQHAVSLAIKYINPACYANPPKCASIMLQ